ncbi:MAG: TetR family transcriptional regulator, partial [Puniceicoccales bacterium]
MARRTKDESEQTHCAILDAAIEEFLQRGVARTTLQDIANASGFTRGAVYHHFKNKGEIIVRLLESVRLPVETIREEFAKLDSTDPLAALHQWCKNAIHNLANDERACKIHW